MLRIKTFLSLIIYVLIVVNISQSNAFALEQKTQQILDNLYQVKKKDFEESSQVNYENYSVDYSGSFQDSRTNLDGSIQSDIGLDIMVKVADDDFVRLNNVEREAYNSLLSGEYENAIVLYLQILEERPNDLNVMVAIASAYHKLGDYAEAEAYYAGVLAVDAGYQTALYNYLALVSQNDPDNALIELMRLAEINKNDAYLHAQLAYIFAQAKNYEKAIKHYRISTTIDPNNYNYRYNLAVAFDSAGDLKNAQKMYWEILKSIPNEKKSSIPFVEVRERYALLKSIT